MMQLYLYTLAALAGLSVAAVSRAQVQGLVSTLQTHLADVAGSPVEPLNATQQTHALSGVLHADLFQGKDIGAKVNAAIAARAGTCGTVDIAPGSYTFTTTIYKSRCVTLEANNAVLTWIGGGQPAMVLGTPGGTGADYTQGSVRNLTLLGTSVKDLSVGMFFGGKGQTSYNIPADTQDYLETLQNVHISGFNFGNGFGSQVFQDTWSGSSATNDGENLAVLVPFGSENMNFYGFQCLNAINHGFYAPDMGGAVYNFISSSFDYNNEGAFFVMNGDLHFSGHVEQTNNAVPFDGPDVDGAATFRGIRLWIGNATNFVLGGVKIPGIVRAYGWNPQITVADGITVYAPGASAIRSFVNWAGEGNSGTLLVGNYWTPTVAGVNFPAYSFLDTAAPSSQRNPPAFLRYNLYNQYAPTSSLVTDETILRGSINTYPGFPGVIGGNANYNGVLPPVPGAPSAPMSGGGGYIGWNAEPGMPGEADWFSTYPGQNGNADGHAFWVMNNAAWTQVGGFTRGGRIYAPHGARVMPTGSNTIVDGFTGTCPANATFTFVGGILTGCR